MAPSKNSVKLASLALASTYQPQRLAVGINLAQLQYAIQSGADEEAPHFPQGAEPTQDGRAYRSTAGTSYYRPQLRVAQRSVDPKGPDVRFLKDAEGNVWLHFTLEEAPPAGLAEQAEPFNVRVEELRLEWRDATGASRRRLFDRPTLAATEDPPGSAEPNFEIRVGAKLGTEEVEELFSALRRPASAARVVVKLSYGYWVDEAPGQGSPSGTRPTAGTQPSSGSQPSSGARPPAGTGAEARPSTPAATTPRLVGMIPLRNTGAIAHAVRTAVATAAQPPAPAATASTGAPATTARAVDARAPAPRIAAAAAPAAAPAAATGRTEALKAMPLAVGTLFGGPGQPLSAGLIRKILDEATQRDHRRDFRRVTLERSVPFTFDPELAQNRPIYSALTADSALGDAWVNTSFGWIRTAPFPNTVYRLPDEVRLAYNPDLGLPHMMSALYEDAEGEVRVRVTLGAAPWHDPERLTALRDYLYESTAGALAAPAVVVGGYQSARLRLTSAFPEEIRSLAGEEAEVSLEGGFTITLDLSLEFYKFLCELLTGSLGLTGEIAVTLETAAPAAGGGSAPASGTGAAGGRSAERIQRIVPVRLNLADLVGLPLDVQVEKDAVSPTRVEVRNLARSSVRVTGCAARLLQYDPNSVVPISVLRASATAPFPLELEPRGAAAVALQPDAAGADVLWNAVAVELFGQDLTETPTEVLERVHSVAASATLTWVITVECPLFLAPTVPEKYAMLYKVEVQISRPGYAAQQVVLGRETPRGSVTMQRTLRDVLAADAGSIGTFTYRVRNVYFDRQGSWSEPREGEGSNLFVFPNPVEND